MPPVNRRPSSGYRSATPSGRRRRKLPSIPRTISFRRGTKIGAKSSPWRSSQNVTKLMTLSRKQENLSIQFREEFDFQNMGYDAGSSPMLLRINLNDPVNGGSIPAPTQGIATVIGALKTGSTDPVYTRHSYNDKKNLSDRLDEYFNEYRVCVVTSSEVTFNVRPKINQVSGTGFINTMSVVPYQSRQATGQSPTGPTIGPLNVLDVTAPNATGDLYVWCVRQQAQGQLYTPATGVAPLTTLKAGIPGVRMTKLNVTATNTRGCSFKLKYTPRAQYQIKDWKDKKEVLNILNAAVGNPAALQAYAYLGIGGRINGKDPSPPGATPTSSAYLANCVVEVSVKYNLNFSERKNIDGNNEPVPHFAEL